tara:strand:- start:446 stop:754 length:309 start_codon:yes stop_codon:yes gene_type:complete
MSLKYKEVPGRILPQVWGSSQVTDRVEVKGAPAVRDVQGARMPGGLMNKVYTEPTMGLRGNVTPLPGQMDIEFPPTHIRTTPGNGVIPNRVRVNKSTTQWVG